jgi:hypothetical protein
MAEDIERLNYYQRQYLGATDFKAEQAYHRDMRRRHNLGQHTWGIVVGLELVEKPKEDSSGVDVYVQPGMAVDGFGREIILTEPFKLSGAQFDAFNTLKHRAVYIAYDEEAEDRPTAGYELCDVENQFSRVRESYQIIVEPKTTAHDDITVAGKVVGPPPPVNVGDLTIMPDESVPYQELPDDPASSFWLVRLGSANWDGVNQMFLPAAAGRLLEEREYAGNVTAEILAPDKKLLIRDRATATLLPLTPDKDGADVTEGVGVELEGSLQVDRLLTAKADVQIHGRKLDFRDIGGDTGNVELTIVREDSGGGGGVDLQVNLGDDDKGKNRLAIRAKDKDKVTIADNGDTLIDGNVTVQNEKNLLMDGGQIRLQKKGSDPPEWGIKVDGENLQFTEPDDSDRVVFEILDVAADLDDPVIRLHGEANATLSANQLIHLTDGGTTTLHTHVGATTTTKGMVEIATPGETATNGNSGVRVVIPADDTRLLTQFQKDSLTNGGLTTLHRHPNGILNNVSTLVLHANTGTDIASVNLGSAKRVVAFIYLRAVDPLASFDQSDGLFADIFRVDGAAPLGDRWFGGDHFGASGTDDNLMRGIYTGIAQELIFRLRSTDNAVVWAVAIIFFETP